MRSLNSTAGWVVLCLALFGCCLFLLLSPPPLHGPAGVVSYSGQIAEYSGQGPAWTLGITGPDGTSAWVYVTEAEFAVCSLRYAYPDCKNQVAP